MKQAISETSGKSSVHARLRRFVETGRIPQSLLLIGPEKGTLKEIALTFARMILKTEKKEHPDIRVFVPEGKVGLHPISSMRKFSEDVYLSPFESSKKVFILLEAERMLPTSANALLKTFEEPAPDSVIILATSHPSQMLPTVLSRCQKISIGGECARLTKDDHLYKLVLNAVASGSLNSYNRILDLTEQLSAQIDEEHKELEQTLKAELIDNQLELLSSLQKETLLKEVDGTVSLSKKERVKEVLIALQSWYRDLYLIKVKGNKSLLLNPDFEEELSNIASSTELPSLQFIEQIVRDTILSLDRSTTPKICLENFFLRLI